MSEAGYADRSSMAFESLNYGDCYQINIGALMPSQNGDSLYRKTWAVQLSSVFWFHPFGEQMHHWPVYPERFLELKDNVIETKPIKNFSSIPVTMWSMTQMQDLADTGQRPGWKPDDCRPASQ